MSSIYKSNPHVNRLDGDSGGLKSPGIVSSINRSQRDLPEALESESKKTFIKNLAEHSPELYQTLHGGEPKRYDYRNLTTNKINDNYRNDFLTLRKNHVSPILKIDSQYPKNTIRRESNGSGDRNYTETYHIQSQLSDNDYTDTVKSISKKTVPTKDGRTMLETIESTKTVSKSKSRNGKDGYENGYKVRNYPSKSYNSNGGVIIEVRNSKGK